MSERIVIANSVGIDQNGYAIIHSPSRWTNSSKNHDVFTYYPWELAYTSALLKRETDYYVKFLDGCLEKYTGDAYFERISEEKPTILIMEPATRTWNDDVLLMQRIKKTFGTKLVVVGQHATAFPDEVSKFADYVVCGEYEMTVLAIVRGHDRKSILGLYPNARRPLLDINTLPWPEDNDVARIRYGIPGEPSSEYLEVQAYASRGCPMNCNFCVCRHLYYSKPNWRPRDPQDVCRELLYLREKYTGMEGVFFDEEFHNVKKDFILNLSQALIAHKLNDLKIEAMCAYYTLDQEMMDAMQAAGYYLLRVGIETAGKSAAEGINLGAKYNLEKLRSVLRYAKQIGMKMYGTFTFGAPGSTRADDQATLDLMEEIIGDGLLWRFQTSICTPQPGAPFYDWAKEKGYLKTYASNDYDGGNHVVLDYPDYSSVEIMQMYMKAQKYFDLAVEYRFQHAIPETIKALQQMNMKRVLLLRTTRMPQMKIAMQAIRTAHPNVVIDLLAQPAVESELKELVSQDIVNDVLWCNDGFFAAASILPEQIESIKQAGYDSVGVVYNNLKGRGYENVEACVSLFEIDRWLLFNAEGRLINKEELERMRIYEQSECGCVDR